PAKFDLLEEAQSVRGSARWLSLADARLAPAAPTRQSPGLCDCLLPRSAGPNRLVIGLLVEVPAPLAGVLATQTGRLRSPARCPHIDKDCCHLPGTGLDVRSSTVT